MKIQLVTVTVDKLSAEGFGHLIHNEMDLYVIGCLPGETVVARIVKKRKGKRWAIVQEVITPSPDRIEALENHYLSCSPWQVIPYPKQIELKKQMLQSLFDVPVTDFFEAPAITSYRTKAEFGFWYENQSMYIGFHERGKPFVLTPLPEGCVLLSDKTNKVALRFMELINKHAIPKTDLKSLIIRESKTKDQRIALLCVKREDFILPFSLTDFLELDGLTVAFSNPLSPASLITKELLLEGQNYLEEEVSGITLQYPLDGFFQNNIPLFGKALSLMQDVVNSQMSKEKIVELYSGVGTIGLALTQQAKHVIGVEVVPSSIQFARENARRNNIKNYECYDIAAENMDSKLLAGTDVLILDPPRIGLHSDVVNSLTQYLPKTILYLSCNPETQARDYEMLKEHYSPTALYGFDFYPQTNHMESLLVLELKKT
jgi:23S rRNA (uracil1939-C5)-methyltransferase